MFIACKQSAQTEVRGTSYNFVADKFGRFVAEVHNIKDQAVFLAAVDQYREVVDPDKPDPDPNQPSEAATVDEGGATDPQATDPVVPIPLTDITGIGPAIETKLKSEGINDARQIAAMTTEAAQALDDKLGLGGRIERDDWIGQAKALVG